MSRPLLDFVHFAGDPARYHSSRIAVLIALLSATLAASSCDGSQPLNTATVSYEQVGACQSYQSSSGNRVSSGPNAAFVVFRVFLIDNSASKIAFNFDPEKLFVDQTARRFIDNNLELAREPHVVTAHARTAVPGASSVSVGGFAITVVTTADPQGSTEANKTAYLLQYATGSGDPSVIMNKNNSGTTSFANTTDCAALLPL